MSNANALQTALKMSSGIRAVKDETFLLNGRKVKNLKYCHALVRDTAKQLAGAIYETAMRDNENYMVWKKLCNDMEPAGMQAEWINLMWPRMLDDARATLAKMLGAPGNEHLKPAIHDALIKDANLRAKGRGPKPLFRV